MNWYRFHQSGFKTTPVILPCPTMQGLVKDVLYVSQGKVTMSGRYYEYHWICAWRLRLPRGLINQ